MPEPAGLIQYASEGEELPADRLLRRTVAGAAIAYGAEAIIRTALHVGLTREWLASPSTMTWAFNLGMRAEPLYRDYWSTPAAAAMEASQLTRGCWLLVLIVLLTLPPLARRMVR